MMSKFLFTLFFFFLSVSQTYAGLDSAESKVVEDMKAIEKQADAMNQAWFVGHLIDTPLLIAAVEKYVLIYETLGNHTPNRIIYKIVRGFYSLYKKSNTPNFYLKKGFEFASQNLDSVHVDDATFLITTLLMARNLFLIEKKTSQLKTAIRAFEQLEQKYPGEIDADLSAIAGEIYIRFAEAQEPLLANYEKAAALSKKALEGNLVTMKRDEVEGVGYYIANRMVALLAQLSDELD